MPIAENLAERCATCGAEPGKSCRTRTTGRITDTHKARWLPIVQRRAERLAADMKALVEWRDQQS